MAEPTQPTSGATRRDFLKYVVAGGSSLVIGVSFDPRKKIHAQEGPDFVDVGDVLIGAEQPYFTNLVLEVTPHNRVRFELPRLDKGQGIITAVAMMIAEEMDADYERCDVELSDARADRPYSLTGYSSTIRAMWEWVPLLAAQARAQLITAAANRWGIVDASTLTVSKSMVIAPDGRRANFGELAAEASAVVVPLVSVTPKPVGAYTLVGNPVPRRNAREIATGAQAYTLDLDLPGVQHAVVARPPDIYGTVTSFDATAALALPNVAGVVEIPQTPGPMSDALEGGVAVAARTYQEAFEARDALQIQWGPGTLAGVSDSHLRAQLAANAIPLAIPAVPGSSLDATFEFPYMNHAPLEVQTAVAHVQGNTAEIWFASQSPLICTQLVAAAIGIPEANVTLHVPPCGGSFGRHLFSEAPIEAAIISKELGVPIKLMWTRQDDIKHGRFRPMAHANLRANWNAVDGSVTTYEHSLSAAETDFRHGLGDAQSASGFDLNSTSLNQSVFEGSITLPYDFPSKQQNLSETEFQVPTCSWRSIYSGFTVTQNEIFIDEIARATQSLTGLDEVGFRVQNLSDDRARACLQQVAAAGNWGAALPAGHAQGVACHVEYRSAVAFLVQVDASDPLNPRMTHAWICADVGLPINPLGLEAQLQGVLMDGWTTMFRAGNHLDNGVIRENSYGDFPWARMSHAPPTTVVHIMPPSPGEPTPGGCGELGLPPACAAPVNAYVRATGNVPQRQFPILEFV